MLVKVNNTDNLKSIYKCDKCNCIIYNSNLYRLTFMNKTYHLCKKHALILERWLKNAK